MCRPWLFFRFRLWHLKGEHQLILPSFALPPNAPVLEDLFEFFDHMPEEHLGDSSNTARFLANVPVRYSPKAILRYSPEIIFGCIVAMIACAMS